MLIFIITVLGGLLGASGYIISQKPNAEELISRMAPYKGGIGVAMVIVGIWLGLKVVFMLDDLVAPISWLITTITAAINLSLGFLLGYDLISENLLERNEKAETKGLQIRKKLVGFQSKLGLGALGAGALYLLQIIF